MDEVRRALHAAMHEEWECKLRRLLGEELMVMRMDVLQRQQQLQQMQFAEHLRAVKMMLEEHQREEAGPPAEVAAPAKEVSPRKGRSESPVKVTRSQARHHTWHNQSSSCSPGKQAERSSLLKLPAESLRTVVRATQAARSPIRFADDKSATPSARAAALAAAAMRSEKEAASAASRNASPIHSPNTREDDIESRSARSEENEKWKQNWTRQMRARLSSQLGDLGHGPSKKKTKGAVTRSMSKFIGADASARHRQTLAQMYQVHPPKTKLEQLVDGTAFQLAVGFIIFANAVFIGIMTDVSMQNVMATPPQGDPSWFHLVNQIFVGMFVAEVLIRLIAKRLDFVYGIDWKWNIFDFCL
ncbi:YAH3, partial [Symbiodinium pilosum]